MHALQCNNTFTNTAKKCEFAKLPVYCKAKKGQIVTLLAILASILAYFRALKSLLKQFSVDTVGMVCRQSRKSRVSRHCRDRLSTTALLKKKETFD